ncbi:MAG TPA: hypothetical protein VIL28_07720 [Steroidobacteraceae bacterium]
MSERLLRIVSIASAVLMLSPATPNVALAGSIAAATRQLPELDAPPGGTAAWIAQAMRLNGVPMTIKSFAASMNAQEVLHYYERRLRSSNTQTKRWHEGENHVLGVLSDNAYITVRARNTAHGAQGTITVTPPLAKQRSMLRTRFPHPPSARVANLQQYEDEGIEAEHISFVSAHSVASAARELTQFLREKGWTVHRSAPMFQTRGGHVIEAQKDASLAHLSFRRLKSGETAILVVWKKT